MKTLTVNIPIQRGIRMLNNPDPLEAKVRDMTIVNQRQAGLIETQERILSEYERQIDQQASRLTKYRWTIGLLILALIIAALRT